MAETEAPRRHGFNVPLRAAHLARPGPPSLLPLVIASCPCGSTVSVRGLHLVFLQIWEERPPVRMRVGGVWVHLNYLICFCSPVRMRVLRPFLCRCKGDRAVSTRSVAPAGTPAALPWARPGNPPRRKCSGSLAPPGDTQAKPTREVRLRSVAGEKGGHSNCPRVFSGSDVWCAQPNCTCVLATTLSPVQSRRGWLCRDCIHGVKHCCSYRELARSPLYSDKGLGKHCL